MVDKNLFLHDLAVTAILKCEGHYLKEWLDYHLLAGVEHFYLYDNDSPDNQREVAAPYVKAGIVDYFNMPGKAMQMVAYNDAVNKFKYQCRYMAFIDGDEFIFPKMRWGGGMALLKLSMKFYRTMLTRRAWRLTGNCSDPIITIRQIIHAAYWNVLRAVTKI